MQVGLAAARCHETQNGLFMIARLDLVTHGQLTGEIVQKDHWSTEERNGCR